MQKLLWIKWRTSEIGATSYKRLYNRHFVKNFSNWFWLTIFLTKSEFVIKNLMRVWNDGLRPLNFWQSFCIWTGSTFKIVGYKTVSGLSCNWNSNWRSLTVTVVQFPTVRVICDIIAVKFTMADYYSWFKKTIQIDKKWFKTIQFH